MAGRKTDTWVRLSYPESLVELPVLCEMCSKFRVVLTIAQAAIKKEGGEALVQLSGKEQEIEKALTYLANLGLKVERTREPAGWRI